MKILITEPISSEGVSYLQDQEGFNVVYKPSLSTSELSSQIQDAVGLIVRSKTQIHTKVVQAAPLLKVIGRAGEGVDNVDVEEATRQGILVMNTPGGNSISAAEHTLALLLSLARKIPGVDAALRSGSWEKTAFVGREMGGKTLGVVGLGKIGSVVAHRAMGFEMKVVAFDPYVSERYAEGLRVKLISLDDLLVRSDFVTLHLPLNEKTEGLICAEKLALMKEGALLVNTARGSLVVEEDVADALEEGRLGGAALDVFQDEPRINPRLLVSDKTVLTPHIAGSTVEAQTRVGLDIALQVSSYLRDNIISNPVNFPALTCGEVARLLPYVQLGERIGSFVSQIARIRISEIGIRYYGELTKLNYKPITSYILKAILEPILSDDVNEVNAHSRARERGISVVETLSSRERSYSNLISIQLKSIDRIEWIEGAVLHQGNLRLVSIDGIPVETQLGEHVLLIRNEDRPGVIGQIGTILGKQNINIASFVLGRDEEIPYAIGVANTDSPLTEEVLKDIHGIAAVKYAHVVLLQPH